MLSCVILNYNDAKTTLSLVSKIKNYSIFSRIIIVDGCSTDESYIELKKIENEHIVVIKADKNGGYGYGNNIGIRYSAQMKDNYVLVANPDVEFSEDTIRRCLDIIKKNSKCVACAPKMKGNREPAYCFKNAYIDIFSRSMVLNRLFRPRYYSKKTFLGKNNVEVFALPGSLVMFDINKFIECGMYDENCFLYNEEMIIGKKFSNNSFSSILCLTHSYSHYHSVSVKKEFGFSLKPKKIAAKSHKLFLRKYCNAGIIPIFMFDTIIVPLSYLEYFVWTIIRRFSGR